MKTINLEITVLYLQSYPILIPYTNFKMATVLWRCLLKIFVLFSFYLYLVQGKSQLIILNEDNWDSMLTGEWMVEL